MAEKKWLDDVGNLTVGQLIQLEDTYRIDSIVAAIEAALMDRATVTATERIVLVIEAMEREVNNGGFNQFFFNSSNEYAGELISALRQIGVPGIAEIAERALRAIGAQPNWKSEQFEEASADPEESIMDELNECDNAYYASEEAIAEKLFGFIKLSQKDVHVGADSS